MQYLSVDLSQTTSDRLLTVTFNPSLDTVVYEITDECRYTPKQIVFKNRYGFYECLTLFKKSNETLNVSSDEFVNAYLSNGAYDLTDHQNKKINIQGKEKLSCNSGYIKETENAIYKEMLLSDSVYLYENAVITPLNVSSSNLEFKTRVNDKLVNYNIEFEYAYNTIQNIW